MQAQPQHPWQKLSSRIAYQNPWMAIREDRVITPGGTEGVYGVFETKHGVFVIALTDDDAIYLTEAYRYPIQKFQWELPSGGIEPGNNPLQAAQNELAEELGIAAEQWTEIGSFGPTYNSCMHDTQYVFLAQKLTIGKPKLEVTEAVRQVKALPFSGVLEMIKDGTLTDGQTMAALMQFMVWRQSGPHPKL